MVLNHLDLYRLIFDPVLIRSMIIRISFITVPMVIAYIGPTDHRLASVYIIASVALAT